MNYRVFKILSSLFMLVLLLAPISVTHAQSVSTICSGSLDGVHGPDPRAIICPAVRVMNIMLLVSGAVFVIMVVYGAIKLSMSLGDPKGYQGAYLTWFWSVIGFLIVLGFFAVVRIIGNMIGIDFSSPTAIFDRILQPISDLLREIGIEIT